MRPFLLLVLVLSACATSRSTPQGEGGPAPAEPATAPPSGPFGTAHPFFLIEASPDGRWLIGCQTREDTNKDGQLDEDRHGALHVGIGGGDRSVPYLFLEAGLGTPLQDFLGADASGRYLAVVRNQALLLIDVWTRTERELVRFRVADPASPGDVLPPPIASFSADGRHLLFLRETEGTVSAVVRELSSGREQRLDAGTGELRKARFSDAGDWVNFWVLPEGTSEERSEDEEEPHARPTHSSSRLRSSCKPNPMGDPRVEQDVLVWRARRLDGGPLRELRGAAPLEAEEPLALLLGRFILRRGDAGELFVEDGSGLRTEWVPASCGGRLLAVDPRRELVVVACSSAGPGSRAPIELHGAEVHRALGYFGNHRDGDSLHPAFPFPRLIRTEEVLTEEQPSESEQVLSALGQRSVLVDLETHSWHRVPAHIVATRGTLALLRDGPRIEPHELGRIDLRAALKTRPATLSLLDVRTGARTPLAEHTVHWGHTAGSLVLAGGRLVDMESGRVMGEIPVVDASVMALDTRGRILRGVLPLERSERRERLREVWGPVSWEPIIR